MFYRVSIIYLVTEPSTAVLYKALYRKCDYMATSKDGRGIFKVDLSMNDNKMAKMQWATGI